MHPRTLQTERTRTFKTYFQVNTGNVIIVFQYFAKSTCEKILSWSHMSCWAAGAVFTDMQ